jgi:hypothetical protein
VSRTDGDKKLLSPDDCGSAASHFGNRIDRTGGWDIHFVISIRRFGAKPRKNFVDDQAASPSSWKTPRMAVWMAA